MRLQCSVRCATRPDSAPSRFVSSSLAIGVERNGSDSFVIHSSSTNKLGRKYKLSGNVERVFVKYCDEGKATIKFRDPPHDLFVQSDPVRLKLFLKHVGRCLRGLVDAIDRGEATAVPPSADVTKLSILSREDYPLKGLPRTLISLRISGLRLCNFRNDILLLRNLKILNLSNNCIECLPSELGEMPNIAELYVNNNNLGNSASFKWITGKQIIRRLRLLDLSSNNLNVLPATICKMQNIVTLKIDDNHIQHLPSGMGIMKNLRYFSAAKNEIQILPASILSLHLEQIDLSANPLQCMQRSQNNFIIKISSLIDICAEYILKMKFHYEEGMIPFTLINYLDSSKYCICCSPTFNHCNYTINIFSLKSFCKTIISDGKYFINFDFYICSYMCYRKYVSRKRTLNETQ